MSHHRLLLFNLIIVISITTGTLLWAKRITNASSIVPSFIQENNIIYNSWSDSRIEEFINPILTPITTTTRTTENTIFWNRFDNIDHDYDTASDDSIQKYVSRTIGLSKSNYIPNDLITLTGENLSFNSNHLQLRKNAAIQLDALAQEFQEIFNKKLVIISAYRSYHYQLSMKKKWCPDTLCAPAGHSEHQLGLAIDIFAATTAGDFLSKTDFRKYYERLAINAHRYGRHNTYQKWVEIDSYQIEPRHRRYLGRELATELFEKKMTFWEWIKENIKK